MMFTGISFAYFGGKRKEEGDERDLPERAQRARTKTEEDFNAEYAESAEDAEERESGLDAFAAKG